MDNSRFAFKTAGLVLAMALLAGCNSSGGGDDGGDGSTGGNGGGAGGSGSTSGDTLPTLSGLSGVPDNDHWLYFTSDADGSAGLYAYNPQLPDNGAELIDDEAYLTGSLYLFHPIARAAISGDTLTDYRPDTIFYRHQGVMSSQYVNLTVPDAFKRVSTGQSVTPATPEQVSSETDTQNLLGSRYFFQFDLDQPENTAIAYAGDASWLQVRLGDAATQAPLTFDADYEPVVPLGDGNPNGWLVIDEGASNQLVQVDLNLASEGAVLDGSGNPVENLDYVNVFSHLGTDKQLVALSFKDMDTTDQTPAPPPEMWLYSAGHPGTIEPLLNDQGEKLTFKRSLFGRGATLPSADQLVVRDQVLYVAFHERSDYSALFAVNPMLYRIDENGWSLKIDYTQSSSGSMDVAASPFLIDGGGDDLVWLIDDTLTRIDLNDYSETPLYDGSVEAPIVDSANGWFYYNDSRDVDSAVAARVDGSKQIRLSHAQWIGASGTGDGNVAMRLAKANISEVFLLEDDGGLAAVSAADPEAGRVDLGQLDTVPDMVRMTGIRPGPHQLMQVEYEDDSCEVIYVNSRQAGSLKHLMAAPSTQSNAATWTRPVYGR